MHSYHNLALRYLRQADPRSIILLEVRYPFLIEVKGVRFCDVIKPYQLVLRGKVVDRGVVPVALSGGQHLGASHSFAVVRPAPQGCFGPTVVGHLRKVPLSLMLPFLLALVATAILPLLPITRCAHAHASAF